MQSGPGGLATNQIYLGARTGGGGGGLSLECGPDCGQLPLWLSRANIHAYTVLFRRVNNDSLWPLLTSFQCFFGENL